MSQQINLFNPIFLKQRKVFTAVPMAQALVALALGLLVLSYYGQSQLSELQQIQTANAAKLEARKKRLATVTATAIPRAKDKVLEAQVQIAEAQLKSLQDAGRVLERGDVGDTKGYSEYFRAFARQSVGGLWLTGLSIDGSGQDIGVRGRALQATLVPDYITRLSHEPVLRGKSFASLQIGQPQQLPTAKPPEAGKEKELAPFVEFSLQAAAVEEKKP